MKLSLTHHDVTVTVETDNDDMVLIDNGDNWPTVQDMLRRLLIVSGYSKQNVDELFGIAVEE